jgi:hypothetical protein
VKGDLLIDKRSGEQFVPRGINWSSFEYACAQGWGYSALDTLDATDPAKAVASAIRAWNVNTVRLPLNQDCWLGTRSAPVTDVHPLTAAGYRAAVSGFVEALNAQGIVVILDLQSRKRDGSNEFGNVAMPDAGSLVFWGQVASEYAADPSVIFDAFNEPYSRKPAFELTWQCWRDGGCKPPVEDDGEQVSGKTYTAVGMTQVVAAIRAAGARQPILLGGLDYANDLTEWLRYAPSDDQLVAAFHNYDKKNCASETCWDSVIAVVADRVPLLTSELGADAPTAGFVSKYLEWADSHRIGALFWVWGMDPNYEMALTATALGTPTAYGELAREWFQAGS